MTRLLATMMIMQAAQARAVEVTPLFNFQVLGGQYFFRSEKGDLSGNASGIVAPALKFDEHLALLPSVSSTYQGTKQVVDLVGSGSIFQEQMDHRVGTRLVITPGGDAGRWRLKPSISYKYELLKETKDESWGRGLFDYYKMSGGFEAEFVYRDPFSLRFGFDYFETHFPNYSSLEAQAATALGNDMARELVGGKVLDTRNFSVFASMDGPISEYVILEGMAASVYQDYYNQRLVDEAGAYKLALREDILSTAGLGVRLPARIAREVRMLGNVDLSLSYNTSNQNSFDAQRVKFMKFYYNYGEIKAGPSVRLYFGPEKRPVALGVGGQWWYRRYPYRPRQNDEGTYKPEVVRTHSYMASTSLSYPMSDHFSLVFDFQYGASVSNQTYEQYYSYNYTVKNYLFGFKYEY
ncbi:MAG: hypothetical protein HY927_05755 [Elusimicrobia bacterium]|nr:hypothetical protein [Elusimicrobiota bacterium]